MASPRKVDTAIVGAGVSGLYTAWRLAQERPSESVAVFERNGTRIGGRLYTHFLRGSKRCVEYGAMRYPVSHVLVHELLQHLDVKTEPFPNLNLRHMYFRGKPVVMGPNGQPQGEIPFNLAGMESPNPYVLLVETLQRAVPGAMGLTSAQWKRVRQNQRVGNTPLWQLGFWNVIDRLVSNEAYQLMYHAIGIESALSNWNAATALQMMSLLVNDFMRGQFYRPTEGWSTLPKKLAKACNVEHGHTLRSLRRSSRDGAYPLELGFSVGTDRVSVRARRVVLAMPRRSIELFHSDCVLFEDAKFVERLAQVERIPAFRLYLDYEKPWWKRYNGPPFEAHGKDLGGWDSGFAVTDLPLRQVFYGTGLGGSPADNKRMLMASYADFHAVKFWTALAEVKEKHARPPVERFRQLLFLNPGPAWDDLLIPTAERQLRELHGVREAVDLPRKTWSGYVDWTRDPYGAAWHAWQPRVRVDDAIVKMRQPIGNLPIYICGEAYSHIQGWVEGALSTTERMLQEKFKLKPPAWLPKGYDLGP